jgi:hypothetical protein
MRKPDRIRPSLSEKVAATILVASDGGILPPPFQTGSQDAVAREWNKRRGSPKPKSN